VQVDDFGSLWDKRDADNILTEVQVGSESTNTIVVVFVHGWHHNADPTDDNLLSFKGALQSLAKNLSEEKRQIARKDLSGSASVKVIGIYVGWRGRSLPSFFDYLTMWWRKDAAERVGDGDVSEFLERLQRIYLRANSYSRYAERSKRTPGDTPYMGLVTVGHSFGGQVVLKAVGRAIEGELVERAPCQTDAVTSPSIPSTPTVERVPIDSFGDLNILINPALEAYQFARIDELYRQLSYPNTQSPQLVVFSADNDSARKMFFPIARGLTRPFRPAFRNSYQGELWGKALGEMVSQQTHQLTLTSDADSLSDADFAPDRRQVIADYDFASQTVFSKVKLSPLSGVQAIPNSPIAVVVTHDDIIDGHSGIFRKGFEGFLSGYIAFIEAKRVMRRYANFKREDITNNVPLPEVICNQVAASSNVGNL
jgi:pimeloyl-ACP methyl ester carboxylesterase